MNKFSSRALHGLLAVIIYFGFRTDTQADETIGLVVGSTITISVNASGTQPFTYQWRKNSSPIGGATASTYVINSAAVGDIGNYSAIVTNSAGSTTSDLAIVAELATSPSIIRHPQPQTVETGGLAILIVSANGTAPLSYQWKLNGSNIPDATDAMYIVDFASNSDLGNYTVVITNSAGSVTSNIAALTAAVEPSFSLTPVNQMVNLSQSATFTVSATGTPSPTIQWQRSADAGITWNAVSNNSTHSGVTTSTLTVATSLVAQSGDRYRAVATNIAGSVNSSSATLTLSNNLNLWKNTYFTPTELSNPGVSGNNAIYGADGLSNLLKYALGLNPTVNATTGLPTVGITASDWTYTYTRPSNVTDVEYLVEVSTNLTTWTTAGVTHGLVTTVDGVETWRATYPLASNPNVFFRLKVSHPL